MVGCERWAFVGGGASAIVIQNVFHVLGVRVEVFEVWPTDDKYSKCHHFSESNALISMHLSTNEVRTSRDVYVQVTNDRIADI